MRTVQPYRRRTRLSSLLGLFGVFLFVAAGVIGVLLALGVDINPFGRAKDDPYMVRIPINSQPIPAYQRVSREHLLNSSTGELAFQRVPPTATVNMSITGVAADGSHVESKVVDVRNVNDQVVFVTADGREIPQAQTIELGGALMNINAIIGRVVKKDKRAGMAFKDDTFFPQGTPEGVAGATPPGMKAVTLDATKLTGVHALNAGDQIDLMASVPVKELAAFQSQHHGRLPSGAFVANASSTKDDSATEPLMLAQGAIVLKPVYVRNEATTSSSLTQGKRIQNVPKYEVAIAVAPDDVIPLQSALDKSLAITCVAHSMQTGLTEQPISGIGPGVREVPVTVRAIPAYDVVSREAFVSPATRSMRMESVSEQEIERQGIITSVEEALGAVARHDIPAGRFVRKSDLLLGSVKSRTANKPLQPSQRQTNLPQSAPVRFASEQARLAAFQQDGTEPSVVGDRPAITRFVPPGHTAFAIPWNRVYGAEHLQIGDELDLLASYSLESEDEEEETETRPDGTKIVRKRHDLSTRETTRTWEESFGFRGEAWFVATDAVVVGPVGFPPPAAAQRALGENLTRAGAAANEVSQTGPPLMIAVADRDAEAVAASLASRRVLFTAAFQPQQDSAGDEDGMKQIAVAAHDVPAYEQFTETMWNGNRRRPLTRLVAADDPRFEQALSVEELKEYEFRVLRIAKRRGDFFSSADFLPVGAGPGVASAAQDGTAIFAVADREIEGLDAFQSGDRVAVVFRGVVKAPSGVVTHGAALLDRPVSTVVADNVRIVKSSHGGRTILAASQNDLTRLQAACAASLSHDDGAESRRSNLLAVALPNEESALQRPAVKQATRLGKVTTDDGDGAQRRKPAPGAAGSDVKPTIPGFDPLGGIKLIEAMIGSRREVHAFPAASEESSASTSARS